MNAPVVKEPVNLCKAQIELSDLLEAMSLPSETHVYARISGRRVPVQALEVDWLEYGDQKPLFADPTPTAEAPEGLESGKPAEPWKQTFTCKHRTRCHGNRQVLGRGPFHSHLKWHLAMGDNMKDCGKDAVEVLEKFASKRRRRVGRPRKARAS